MPTITKSPKASRRKTAAKPAKTPDKVPPILLHTDQEVQAYLAAHLTPVRNGPKGQPIYAYEDHAKLNIIIRPGV